MSVVNLQARPGTISLPEAARRFDISRGHAYRLAATGQFPVRTIKAGRRVLVPVAEVDRALGIAPEIAIAQDTR